MSALPRPDMPPGPHRDLVAALHDLHHRAGWPSLRTLAKETGVSHTTVSKAFSRPTLPAWGTLELLVEAMDGSVEDFRALWLAASAPTDGEARATAPRIAGRRAELDVVRRHLETGTGLLVVSGEAGIGKTTLVETAAGAVEALVAVGHCLPLSTEVPLMPIVGLLRTIRAAEGGKRLEVALAECPAYVRTMLAQLLPELDEAAVVGDDVSPRHLFAAVGQCLSALGARRSLALVIEDLHWADAGTLDLLEHLLTDGAATPMVASWRTEDPSVPDLHRDWLSRIKRFASTRQVALTPLTEEETREQLVRCGVVDAESAARIHARSNGHPLFTAHLAGQPSDAGMPRELAELLERRLDGLGRDASRVVAALGVADRECTADVLGASTGLPEDLLVPALHELTARRLLREQRDEEGTALGHPLLAEAARRRLVPAERAAWHRAVAHALSSDPQADAAEVAEHWRKAGALPHELRWREAAARQAHARTAPDAEAQQWLRALEIHAGRPDLEFDAHAARVAAFDALELSGNLAEALVVARAGVEHLDGLDDHAAAQILRRLGVVEDWISDDTSRGLELVDRALARLQPHGPSTELVHVLDARANHLMDLGRYDEALTTLDQALDVCETLGDDDLFYGASATLGWCQAYLGDLPGALATFERGRARVPRPTGPRREAYVAMSHTDALIQHRRPAEEVAAAAQRAIDVGRAWGLDFHLLTLARANVVEALVKTGRVAEAAEVLRTIDIAEDYDHWPVAWMSGQVAVAQGRAREGLETIRSLEVTGTTAENILHRAHLVAVAHLWLGEPREAWDTLASALEGVLDHPVVARSCQPFMVLARAGADLCERDESVARETLASLHQLRGRASMDPLGPGSVPVVREACTRAWDAELARVERRGSVDQWVAAARSWDDVRAPHDAAYCRWRAAQAALRDGHATVAARLLKRAATEAREHVPLLQAIAATRRSA